MATSETSSSQPRAQSKTRPRQDETYAASRELSLCGIGEAGAYVLGGELLEIPEYVLLRHPAGEVTENVTHRDSRTANARLPNRTAESTVIRSRRLMVVSVNRL